MILNRKDRAIQTDHAFDRPVVQAGVTQLHAAERRGDDGQVLSLRGFSAREPHGEVMVLGRDLDFSCPQVENRMIGAMMTELQFSVATGDPGISLDASVRCHPDQSDRGLDPGCDETLSSCGKSPGDSARPDPTLPATGRPHA